MPPAEAIRTTGSGPDLVLVHGTAVDGESWRPLGRLLAERVRVTRYDRRATARWPVDASATPVSVAEHADDLIELIDSLGGYPVHLFGASFGAIVVLEAVRRRPEVVQAAALFEPAAAGLGPAPAAAQRFLAEFEKQLERGEPERAAEFFHRRVLGDALWKRFPPAAQERARSTWRHIHGDLKATVTYRAAPEALAGLDVPLLLLRGGRSLPAFEAPLAALATALPRARRGVVESAGHQNFAAAWHELAAALSGLMDR